MVMGEANMCKLSSSVYPYNNAMSTAVASVQSDTAHTKHRKGGRMRAGGTFVIQHLVHSSGGR